MHADQLEIPGYTLAEDIGRGGMGVVYRARDVSMNREVAVKILQDQYAPDSPAATRFVAEAQITGQLQHPGIPAVYQMGKLADGRPFLAMKLIKGDTLDQLLKSNASINRLAVFEAIAQAVGYAHAHDVIHRDLKPANVMVGAFGEVQVMDWGLAKVLTSGGVHPRRSEATDPEATTAPTQIQSLRDTDGSITQAGSIMGTPAYMAPEQAAGEIDKIDTRTDVFGLGALLCTLLTNQPPYTGKDAESVRVKAMRGQTEDALARLDVCGAEPEVVALCNHCLAFEPADRPTDGNAVAQEVARLRAAAEDRAKQAELAQARAEVQLAEQRKRRQVWLGLAATLLLGLIVSSLLALWANVARIQAQTERNQKEEQRELAEEAKTAAETSQAETQAVLDFVEDRVFAVARPKDQAGGLGSDVKLRDAVRASLPFLESGFHEQPLIEARLRHSIGKSFWFLGEPIVAVGMYERAIAVRQEKLGPDHPDTLASMNNLANAYSDLGRQQDALSLREKSLTLRRQRFGTDDPDVLTRMSNLAISYAEVGRHPEALRLREETLTLQKAKLGPDHPSTMTSMHNLAMSFQYAGRKMDALQLYEATLTARKRVLPQNHPDTLKTMNNLALSYEAVGRHLEALKLLEETVAIQRESPGPGHPATLASMSNLSMSYSSAGRDDDAIRLREEILSLSKQTFGHDHATTLKVTYNLARDYTKLGRHADALRLLEETLTLQKQQFGPEDPSTLAWMNDLAYTYAALGQQQKALPLRELLLPVWKQKLGPNHLHTLTCMNDLGISYYELRRYEDALTQFREATTLREEKARANPEDLDNLVGLGGLLCNTGMSLRSLNRLPVSVAVFDRAINQLQSALEQQPQSTRARSFLRNSLLHRALAHEQLGRYPHADADWEQVVGLTPDNEKASAARYREEWKSKRK